MTPIAIAQSASQAKDELRSRKRKRHEASPMQPSRPRKDKKGKTVRRFLQGKVLAVSALNMEKGSNEDTYASLKALVEGHGGSVTGQVHKRVHCVVASQSAIQGKSQRVRKAWTKGIPLVTSAWLHQCIAERRVVAFNDYLVSQPDWQATGAKQLSPSTEETTEGTLRRPKEATEEVTPITLSLGCCCICHEEGHSDCPWCADCSVNVNKPSSEKEKEAGDNNDDDADEQPPMKAREGKDSGVIVLDLGCCCICHEEGRTGCEWCVGCPLNSISKRA